MEWHVFSVSASIRFSSAGALFNETIIQRKYKMQGRVLSARSFIASFILKINDWYFTQVTEFYKFIHKK